MRWSEKNSKIEDEVYEIIDDITGELGLRVHAHPEVYWVGRKLQFWELGLPKSEYENFEYYREMGSSVYYREQNMILINENNRSHMAEEVGHMLHRQNSGVGINGRNPADILATRVIEEMIGFFSSKLIEPSRKNNITQYGSFLPEKCNERVMPIIVQTVNHEDDDVKYYFTYNVGYDLGEKLFNYYISDQVSKNFVRKLFFDPMKDFGYPVWKMIDLKYNQLK